MRRPVLASLMNSFQLSFGCRYSLDDLFLLFNSSPRVTLQIILLIYCLARDNYQKWVSYYYNKNTDNNM